MKNLKNIFFKIYNRYHQLFSYLFFSFLAALVDIITGYVLLKITSLNIVVVNTIGIIVSTGLHYLLVTRKTFNCKLSIASLAVYLATFVFGILLQDLVIWLFYDIILVQFFMEGRFLCSKAISLVFSFFILFFVRKKLYSMLNNMQYKKINEKENNK